MEKWIYAEVRSSAEDGSLPPPYFSDKIACTKIDGEEFLFMRVFI